MANPQKGEVEFDAGGQKWTLAFSVNALCELEDELGMGVNEIAEQMGDVKKMRIKFMRAVLWAGLRDHHPEIDLKTAGELIRELSFAKSMETIGQGFALAFPQPEGKGADPPQPGAAAKP